MSLRLCTARDIEKNRDMLFTAQSNTFFVSVNEFGIIKTRCFENNQSVAVVFFSSPACLTSESLGLHHPCQAAWVAGGGDHRVSSRSIAQQRITNRRATATTAIFRRAGLPPQIRSNVSRIHGL